MLKIRMGENLPELDGKMLWSAQTLREGRQVYSLALLGLLMYYFIIGFVAQYEDSSCCKSRPVAHHDVF